MNNESSTNTGFRNGVGGVIGPLLSGGLVAALVAFLVFAAILVIMLSRFDDAKRQAQEAEAGIAKVRTELSSLQGEFDSLTKQKDALAPHIVDWEKRLKEKAEAAAFLATLEGKQRRTESDISEAGKRLDEANRNLVSAEKQKTELNSEVERLKAEFFSLTKSITDIKPTLAQAIDAERRLSAAQNGLNNADARRKQSETDAAAAQTRFDQLQKEADSIRQAREKVSTEAVTLRQQNQTLKDERTTLEEKVSDLKARQAAVRQEEQKLTKLQQQVTSAETRLSEQEERQRRAASEWGPLTNRLDQIRKDVTDGELRRDTAKADSQKADADLAAARKLRQEITAKQGELVRDMSRFEAAIERLKKEKEALEKELGRLEGQKAKQP